jgi:hypothetical protein
MSGGRDPTCPQISAACSIGYNVFPGKVQLHHGSVELKFHGSVQNRTMAGLYRAGCANPKRLLPIVDQYTRSFGGIVATSLLIVFMCTGR